MNTEELVQFVRARRLAVLATVSASGNPQAAAVGVAITDDAEIVLDTTRTSRKFINIGRQPRVALTIGVDWGDEQTVQLEGVAAEIGRNSSAVATYFEQFPDGRQRAESPEIVHVGIRLDWGRYSDFRPGSFGSEDITTAPPRDEASSD